MATIKTKDFDRSKHTLKATRDFQRGTLRKKSGEALTPSEMETIGDGDVRGLVDVSKVVEIVGLGSEAAKEAAKSDDADQGKPSK